MFNHVVYVHLLGRNPKSWSIALFQTGRSNDDVENVLSESFNNVLLDARKKPIITMLEDIKLYVVQSMCNLKLKGSQ